LLFNLIAIVLRVLYLCVCVLCMYVCLVCRKANKVVYYNFLCGGSCNHTQHCLSVSIWKRP